MQFFKINSKTIQSPTEITVSEEDLNKAERTMDGTMVIDVIGKKTKLDVNWEYLRKEEMQLLRSVVNGGTFVTVSYHSPETGEMVTMTAQAEGFSFQPYYDWAKGELLWRGVSVSFTEK